MSVKQQRYIYLWGISNNLQKSNSLPSALSSDLSSTSPSDLSSDLSSDLCSALSSDLHSVVLNLFHVDSERY